MKYNKRNIILKKIKDILQFYNSLIIQLFTAYCLLFTVHSNAQTITKSFPDKVSNRFSDYEIVGKNDLGVVVHYFGANESEIVTYDDRLRIDNRKELPFKGKGVTLENLILLKDKILAFYTTNGDVYQYFKLKILDKKLNIQDDVIVLDSIPQASIGKGKAFYIKTSPDKTKILTFSMLKTKSSYFVRFAVLSDSIKILNRNLFSVTENGEVSSLKSIKINNQGNVIAIIGAENNTGNDDYDYEKYTTLIFNRTTNTISEQVLENQNYVFKNLISEVSTQRDIAYIAASYKSTKNKNDIGIYYQIIDFRTNTVLLNSRMPFTDEILKKSQTNEFKTWQDKATLVKPKRIVPRSDGGFVLVTEGEYRFTKSERLTTNSLGYFNSAPFMPSVKYIDLNQYFDIGVFSINIDGSLDWQTNMPKAQISENDDGYYSSFAFFESNNVLKFLYNEDFYKIGNFVEYNVNPNGLTKRVSVMNSEKQELVMVPLKAKQLDGHSIIFPSEQKRNLQFVLFQY
ncbi:MAG TPA: hypothetical protein PLS10_00490 [Chitinophagales bacterium]|nr:hypothetical protein [Chitinophagales bacterium]